MIEARGGRATSETIPRNLFENYRFVLDNYSHVLSEDVVSPIQEGMALPLHQPKSWQKLTEFSNRVLFLSVLLYS